MSTAKAALVESINKRHLGGLPSRIRTGQSSQRLRQIREMASALIEETAALQHEAELAHTSATVAPLGQKSAIDFFHEVRQFEIGFIKRSLRLANVNQADARNA